MLSTAPTAGTQLMVSSSHRHYSSLSNHSLHSQLLRVAGWRLPLHHFISSFRGEEGDEEDARRELGEHAALHTCLLLLSQVGSGPGLEDGSAAGTELQQSQRISGIDG